MKRGLLIIYILVTPLLIFAQKEWITEAEDKDSKVTWMKDGTIDIVSPKGLTLWNINCMEGDIKIEYDARIVVDDRIAVSRLSDLNCFWLATDPSAKDGSVFANMKKRNGVFVNQYALQLYYLGYGGNHNTTTRFRRYDGDSLGIADATKRPAILREYTDKDNLLTPNHWYHICIEQKDGHVRYTIDGKTLVDYVDMYPHKKGYFGFRTTLAHAQLKNFSYNCTATVNRPIALRWIDGKSNTYDTPQTFGIPFAQGEMKTDAEVALVTSSGKTISSDSWTLASWPDGSVKWKAVATVVPAGTDSCMLTIANGKDKKKKVLQGNASAPTLYFPDNGGNILDSIVTNGIKTVGKVWMEYNGKRLDAKSVKIEQKGKVRTTYRIDGENYILRLYTYNGSEQIKIVHTLIVDSAMNADGIHSLGLRFNIPLRDVDYKRAIVFGKGDEGYKPKGLLTTEQQQCGYHHMPVKPLVSRRQIKLDENGEPANEASKTLISEIASWDGFRMSQLSPNAYLIRKRATNSSPWIGTIEGHRSNGTLAVGDTHTSVQVAMEDFWQSYPSSLQVDNARAEEATATVWLWSPEAEAMSFEHYDTIPHGLNAAYEDVQPGMSTAYGIGRTSTLYITPSLKPIPGAYEEGEYPMAMKPSMIMLPSPEYLHKKRAFGIWSLADNNEEKMDHLLNTMKEEVERNAWYGYFNYGDFMHSYDRWRGEWRYDVGGFAWDNTELATNATLWYSFLRTGRVDLWDMAVAMTRHTAEVDCYHIGPNAPLGSRHNVSHWGCGAKEARISQAFWNRFYYYLTADERTGDLMSEVRDADQLLYTLDPMRLAQPRNADTPCTAPARLRVGPDWVAYAGNWFTEWERTGNKHYMDKILTGMKSIAAMPHGLFSGPKALGYDPATGVITWEGDTAKQNTNHLLSIMGGFEMMNEMMLSINCKEWNDAWLDHACNYKQKAATISRNHFRVPRLQAYGYWKTGNRKYLSTATEEVDDNYPLDLKTGFFTNDFATWGLDYIFMKEVCR